MKARPTCHLPSRSIARTSPRGAVALVSCVWGCFALSCADDPGVPSPLEVQQMGNSTTGTPAVGGASGDPGSADPGSATPSNNGDPNGAALGVNPSEPPPPNTALLPPRTTSTSEQDPATEPAADTEPAQDAEEMPADMPAGGGFFGTGGGTDDTSADDPATDDSADDTTDPQTDTGTGAMFGGGFAGTPTTPAPAAMTCTSLAVGLASGDIGTEAKCFTVTGTLQGWQVSNLGMRSLTVNGAPATPPMLPAASDGGYTFAFGAGDPTYTAFSTW